MPHRYAETGKRHRQSIANGFGERFLPRPATQKGVAAINWIIKENILCLFWAQKSPRDLLNVANLPYLLRVDANVAADCERVQY